MIRRHITTSIALAASLLAFGAAAAGSRSYTTGRTVLEVGGKVVGAPLGVSGGGVVGEVQAAGTDKRVASSRPEEIELQVSNGLDASFWSLIAQALQPGTTRITGSVAFLDGSLREAQKLAWTDGILTEFGIPGLDAAAKDLGYFNLRILPERASRTWGSGAASAAATTAGLTKRWQLNGFRLSVAGLNTASVSKVEPFAIRAGAVQEKAYGDQKVSVITPSKRTISDLVFTLRESDAKSVIDWYNLMVQGRPAEKSATLELLSPGGAREPIAAFDLEGVGIYRLDVEKSEGGETERRLQAFAYVENARFRPISLGK